ncbi:MAG: 1,4-dihydroxy-2-naphthoate octaprenyltransferase [Actinobacteria bacterium]|nr:1,4-dihydroxy-2-naphthoate octaprenyltransferase [Actinomycetota bacterium]
MAWVKVKAYFFATRPWSFSCCAQPAFLGNLLAWHLLRDAGGFTFNWLTLALTVVGMVVAQAATNLVNDYFDYRWKCDLVGNTGARNPFFDPRVTHGGLLVLTAALVLADAALAVYYLVVVGGWVLWVILAAAAFMLFFYTAPPISLKYHALGDLFIILISGLGGTFGAFYVQAAGTPYTVRQALTVLLFCLPVAFMGDVILNANNTRDVSEDRKVKAFTFAGVVGEAGGVALEHFLVLGSYLVALVLAPILLTPLTLVTLLSVPIAWRLLYKLRHKEAVPREAYDRVDLDGASLNLVFCTLYVGALALGLTVL